MKLIICGNGFDMHHKLKTDYKAYRDYLKKHAPNVLRKFEEFQWFNESCKGNQWRDVEETLAINFEGIISFYKAYYNDPDGSIEFDTDFEDWTRFIYTFTGQAFFLWLSSINTNTALKDTNLESLFTDAICITFNYTDTVEHLYGVAKEKILYLHGNLHRVIVEHCLGSSILPTFKTIEEAECYNRPIIECDKWNSDIIRSEIQFGAPLVSENKFVAIFNNIQEDGTKKALKELSEKSTKRIYENLPRLEEFLKEKDIEEIIILGQSLLGPDDLYYSECIIPMYKNKKWTAYWHRGKNGELDDYHEKKDFFQKYNISDVNFVEW